MECELLSQEGNEVKATFRLPRGTRKTVESLCGHAKYIHDRTSNQGL